MAQRSNFPKRAEPTNWNPSNSTTSSNHAQIIPLPSTSRASSVGEMSRGSDEKTDRKAPRDDKNRVNFFGKSLMEKTYFFTGTVERIITWHRMFKGRCYYEVMASVVAVQDDLNNPQIKIILLKDKKGPILQVLHYLNHIVLLKDFSIGQNLRCVGYMTGPNILTAVSIRLASPEEMATLKRYCHIGDIAINGLIEAETNK